MRDGGEEATEQSPDPSPPPAQAIEPEGSSSLPARDAAAPVEPSGSLAALALGALGVVFGDIGTSPLYTFQECVGGEFGADPTPENIWGILSLIFWSLTIIVAFKYVTLLMKADNHGEGGIMALLALAPERMRQVVSGRIGAVSLMVIGGAALLFGDGVITPAISVLSAVEGLKSVDPASETWVVPLTVAILIGLFTAQSRGTGALGSLFGPIMGVWFVTIAILGFRSVLQRPDVLWGLLPHHGIGFLLNGGWHAFALLGSVVLAVTGGEALYADMGHFGRQPIRRAWFVLVFPALVLCYFGQGALILENPEGVKVPFFALVDHPWSRVALVLLATAATIIASQGLISAVFSLSHQAIRLGYLPRLQVRHTSGEVIGQIYVPFVNRALAVLCITLVLVFRASTALAAAFGLAVSGTMLLTSLIFYQVAVSHWGWHRLRAGLLVGFLLLLEAPFLAANLIKLEHGGYIPLLIGAVIFAIMSVWSRGRSLLRDHYVNRLHPVEELPHRVQELRASKVPGIGVYLTGNPTLIPRVMESQLEKLHCVFETVVMVSVSTAPIPFVPECSRMSVERILDGSVYRLRLHYGFREVPDIPTSVDRFRVDAGLDPSLVLTYLLGRESFVAGNKGRMPAAQEALFSYLYRNCLDATSDFKLPVEHVLEINNRLDL